MNILITGAGGFTATHLIQRLRLEGDVFLAGTDAPVDVANSKDLDSYARADLTDFRQVVEVVRKTKPNWIFNLAGLARGSAPDLYRVNLVGAVHVLEAVKTECSEAAVLLIGSAAEYGIWPSGEMPLSETHECRPMGAYGLSKQAMTLAAQDYVRTAGVKVALARPFNLIGAGMPSNLVAGAIVQRAKSALTNGESTIAVGNADTKRDFIAIEDAVDAYVRLLQAGHWGEVFNICSGEPHSIRSVVEILLSFSPRPIQVIEDASLKRSNDAPLVVGDGTKFRHLCGFSPRVPLHDALRAAWDHIMDRPLDAVPARR